MLWVVLRGANFLSDDLNSLIYYINPADANLITHHKMQNAQRTEDSQS